MTFALVLLLLINGRAGAFILDSGLSYADCRAAIIANGESAALVCELE